MDERTTRPPRPALLRELLKPEPHLQHTSLETPVEESAHKPNSPASNIAIPANAKSHLCFIALALCLQVFSLLPAKFKHATYLLVESRANQGGHQGWVRMQGEKAKASIIFVVLCNLLLFSGRFRESGAAFTTDSPQTLL